MPRTVCSSGSRRHQAAGLRFQVILPSGSRTISIGSRLATTTKSELPDPGKDRTRRLCAIYASSFDGQMPSIDRKNAALVSVGGVGGDDATSLARRAVGQRLHVVDVRRLDFAGIAQL